MKVKDLFTDGLWSRNIVLGQLLALCPLLAVTTTTINGLGMGLATLLVLVLSNLGVSLLRRHIHRAIRIPCFVVIIATMVTMVDQWMAAYTHELHKVLGLFIPLIVTNCAVLGRAESFAYSNSPGLSALDGVAMGLGFMGSLVMIGALREIVGTGTLLSGAALLGGEPLEAIELTLLPGYRGFLLAVLPPGGFFAVASVLALKKHLERGRLKKGQELPVLNSVSANS